MTRTIRSFRAELMKLRRPRVLYGALGGLIGCTILVTVLTFATAPTPPERLTAGFTNASRARRDRRARRVPHQRHHRARAGTLRTLLLRQPLRDRLLAGKALALVVCTAGALLVALAVSVASAALVTAIRGTPTGPWLADAASGYANTVLAAACYGAIGLALGVLLRSTAVAVGVALFWFIMVENIARNTWPDAGPCCPACSPARSPASRAASPTPTGSPGCWCTAHSRSPPGSWPSPAAT